MKDHLKGKATHDRKLSRKDMMMFDKESLRQTLKILFEQRERMRNKWIKTGREVEGFDKPGEGKEKLLEEIIEDMNDSTKTLVMVA